MLDDILHSYGSRFSITDRPKNVGFLLNSNPYLAETVLKEIETFGGISSTQYKVGACALVIESQEGFVIRLSNKLHEPRRINHKLIQKAEASSEITFDDNIISIELLEKVKRARDVFSNENDIKLLIRHIGISLAHDNIFLWDRNVENFTYHKGEPLIADCDAARYEKHYVFSPGELVRYENWKASKLPELNFNKPTKIYSENIKYPVKNEAWLDKNDFLPEFD